MSVVPPIPKDDAKVQEVMSEVASEVVMRKATEAAPFLNLPFFRTLIRLILKKIMDASFGELARHFRYTWIDFETEADRKAYDLAAEKIRTLDNEEAPDAKEVTQAREEFRKTLRELIRIRPS